MENKLIAEFMGFGIDGKFAYIPDEGSPLEESMLIVEMKYHTSWDWLMPVVDKINSSYNIKIDIGYKWVEVRGNIEKMFLYDTSINLAYKAVIYSIKEIKKT